MKVITALLFAGVVFVGGMATMAAGPPDSVEQAPALTLPEVAVPTATVPEIVVPDTTVPDVESERPDVPSASEEVRCPDEEFCDDPPIVVRPPEDIDEPGPVDDPESTETTDPELASTETVEEVTDDETVAPDTTDELGSDVLNEECVGEECTPINRPPEPQDDRFTFDVSALPAPIPVLNNDSDPDDDDLTIVGHSPSQAGLTCGERQCTIDADMPSTIRFSYTVFDGTHRREATATVVVVDPPTVEDRSFVVDSSLDSQELDVLPSEELPQGFIAVFSAPDPALGTVECATRSCTFSPTGPSGTTSFTYGFVESRDRGAATFLFRGTVTVRVIGPPQPQPDEFEEFVGDDPVVLDVLANDSDPDGEELTIVGSGESTLGDVDCGPEVCEFTPGFDEGTAAFEYTVSDGERERSASVTVLVINRDPVAVDDEYTVRLDESTVLLPVLDNDVEPDGQALTIVGATEPTGGMLSCDEVECSFNHLGQPGTHRFRYTVSDGDATASATVTVEVPRERGTGGGNSGGDDTGDGDSSDVADGDGGSNDDADDADDDQSGADEPDDRPGVELPIDAPGEVSAPRTERAAGPSQEPEPSTGRDGSSRPPSGPETPNTPPTPPATSTGGVSNSAPTSGSALSLVSALALLLPTAALLRRRHHNPNHHDFQEGEL